MVAARVSPETSTANQPSPFSTTVRQQPAWLIEAPMSMVARSKRGLDLEAAVAVGVAHGAHPAHVGDDAGEHSDPLVAFPEVVAQRA